MPENAEKSLDATMDELEFQFTLLKQAHSLLSPRINNDPLETVLPEIQSAMQHRRPDDLAIILKGLHGVLHFLYTIENWKIVVNGSHKSEECHTLLYEFKGRNSYYLPVPSLNQTAVDIPRDVSTKEELAALPPGTQVKVDWDDNALPDCIVTRTREETGVVESGGYELRGTEEWLDIIRWDAQLTVLYSPPLQHGGMSVPQ